MSQNKRFPRLTSLSLLPIPLNYDSPLCVIRRYNTAIRQMQARTSVLLLLAALAACHAALRPPLSDDKVKAFYRRVQAERAQTYVTFRLPFPPFGPF